MSIKPSKPEYVKYEQDYIDNKVKSVSKEKKKTSDKLDFTCTSKRVDQLEKKWLPIKKPKRNILLNQIRNSSIIDNRRISITPNVSITPYKKKGSKTDLKDDSFTLYTSDEKTLENKTNTIVENENTKYSPSLFIKIVEPLHTSEDILNNDQNLSSIHSNSNESNEISLVMSSVSKNKDYKKGNKDYKNYKQEKDNKISKEGKENVLLTSLKENSLNKSKDKKGYEHRGRILRNIKDFKIKNSDNEIGILSNSKSADKLFIKAPIVKDLSIGKNKVI